MEHSSLTEFLLNRGVLKTPEIIDAFDCIDRIDFVPNDGIHRPYGDYPIPIGHGQTNSQPFTVAFMLELLAPEAGDSILDIGSGSGWTTALLAHIVSENGHVLGLERVSELVTLGKHNLRKYPCLRASIKQAKAQLGIDGKIFDRILVSAAAKEFPTSLIAQVKVGGKLVIPVGSAIYEVKRCEEGVMIEKHYGFTFVPLIYSEEV